MRRSFPRGSPALWRCDNRFMKKPFYRLVHAEGDGFPGFVLDRFGGTVVAQITTAGMENLLVPLKMALEDVLAPEVIILRNDAPVA